MPSLERIDSDDVQQFLFASDDLFAARFASDPAALEAADNFYLILMEYRKHLFDLFRRDRRSSEFAQSLRTTNRLLAIGTPSVKDATVIQIVDLIIRDDELMDHASAAGLETLSNSIQQRAAYWQEYKTKKFRRTRR
jgi:hypothetical protein